MSNAALIPARPDAASRNSTEQSAFLPVALVVAATLFNAGLAIINAQVKPLTSNVVILCEVVIVTIAHIHILRHFERTMVKWYFLALVFGIFAIFRIGATDNVDAKYFRDILVIITFILLGMTSDSRRAIQIILTLEIAVVLGILLEATCVQCYGDLFAVKDFYVTTRGVGESEFTNLTSDLYVSATRPEERFLPFFDLHRLSSIFLEPVSLGNFVVIALSFTMAFWSHFGTGLRVFSAAAFLLMIFACDGRLASLGSIAIIAMSLGHRFLPRHTGLLFLPAVTALALGATAYFGLKPGVDDLSGRIAYTSQLISSLTPLDYLGVSDRLLEPSVDAGAVYLTITQSLFGLIGLWVFTTFAATEISPEQKIYKNGVLLYLALTMMVSYSFLSIKTAAPLWFAFGVLLKPLQTAAAPPRPR